MRRYSSDIISKLTYRRRWSELVSKRVPPTRYARCKVRQSSDALARLARQALCREAVANGVVEPVASGHAATGEALSLDHGMGPRERAPGVVEPLASSQAAKGEAL